MKTKKDNTQNISPVIAITKAQISLSSATFQILQSPFSIL